MKFFYEVFGASAVTAPSVRALRGLEGLGAGSGLGLGLVFGDVCTYIRGRVCFGYIIIRRIYPSQRVKNRVTRQPFLTPFLRYCMYLLTRLDEKNVLEKFSSCHRNKNHHLKPPRVPY